MTLEDHAQHETVPVVLTIAGSDSGGGAGIQADLKTFSALEVYGTSAITCVTAQNPRGVYGISSMGSEMVAQQIKAVCDAFPVSVAKTGMLYSAEIIHAVATADIRQGIPILVVDPVMVSASGARLLQDDAIDVLCDELLPQARLLTPNLHEAELLCGHPIASLNELKAAAHEIGDRFDTACVIKGGHLEGMEVVDFLYDEGEEYLFSAPRVMANENHGAGCAFSAAIVAFLARGDLLNEAVGKAKMFVHEALQHANQIGNHGPLNFVRGGEAVLNPYS
jgi:hydroxymethylpyrimidine kinase/phosphomethylpyrimidine kinase